MSGSPAVIDTHVHVIAEDEAARPLQPMSLSGAWCREAFSLLPADDRARCRAGTAASPWERGETKAAPQAAHGGAR